MAIHALITGWDLLVIFLYLAALVGMGLFVSFKLKGSHDLFLGGKSIRWYNIGGTIFATNMGASMLIASSSVAYKSGMVAANFEWLAWMFLLLVSIVFLPHYMRMKVTTMPEFIKRRFGERTYTFLSIYTLFTTLILWLAGTFYAGGVIVSQAFNWPLWLSIFFLTIICTVLAASGGLLVVAITDTFQTILMIGGSATLVLLGLHHVGGFQGLVDSIPADYWKLVRPLDDKSFPWLAMFLGYPVMGIWFWCTDQTIIQRFMGARSLPEAQRGALFAGFLKVIPPFLFLMPGILCLALHPGLDDPDKAYMMMVTHHLPTGMVGFMAVVMIATLVSSIDSGLNSFSTVLTMDIYVKNFRPDASQKEIQRLGRITTVLTALFAMLCGWSMASFGKDMFNLFQSIIAFFAPPIGTVFLLGVLWKRSTSEAAFWTIIVGTITCLTSGYLYNIGMLTLPGVFGHYLMMSFMLFVCMVVMFVVISLLTQPTPDQEALLSTKETYEELGVKPPKKLWIGWAILAVVMFVIYFGFQSLSKSRAEIEAQSPPPVEQPAPTQLPTPDLSAEEDEPPAEAEALPTE